MSSSEKAIGLASILCLRDEFGGKYMATFILECKKEVKNNIQQQVFAGGHPPNY